MARHVEAGEEVRRGRMAKAEQFAAAAHAVHDLADDAADVTDAFVRLCVHAGIAAADVLCAARLGKHSHGEDHTAAVALLASVDATASRHLGVLLGMKTRAGYSHRPVTPERAARAGRAMEALVEAARSAA